MLKVSCFQVNVCLVVFFSDMEISTSIVMFSSEHNLGIVNGVDREKQPNADQPGNKKTHTHTPYIWKRNVYQKLTLTKCTLPFLDLNLIATCKDQNVE